MVMNFKQTKIKFKPQIKLNHFIASVNSTCTQHIPPPGLRGEGIWPPCQSGGGAFANFALPEARAFANPARGFLSEYYYSESFTGKKADWLICQGKE